MIFMHLHQIKYKDFPKQDPQEDEHWVMIFMHLHQIKYKDFPKQDPQEDVGTDYQLLYDKIRQSFKIIDSLVHSITPIL